MIEIEDAPTAAAPADPRIPPFDRVVTRCLVDRWAREKPEQVFAVFDDTGEEWTYARFRELIAQTALGLQRRGVSQGDHVLVWMPNSREQIRIFFALNYLGAVYVPINTAYKGGLLEHVIHVSDARLAIVDGALVERLEGRNLADLDRIIVTGPRVESAPLPFTHHDEVLLPESGVLRAPARPIAPWDPMAIIFTSAPPGRRRVC